MANNKKTLQSEHPEIARYWHPTRNGELRPSDISSASTKIVWWICDNGHAYQKSVAQRVRPRGCPYCSNRKVLSGYNDLASQYPEIAKEWHESKNGELRPEDVVYSTTRKVWWRCEHGHEWEAPVDKRTVRGHGCHQCSRQTAIEGENDLASQYPDIAALLHPINGIDPKELMALSNKKLWWKCDNGYEHPYQRIVYNQVLAHGKCPYCSNKRVLPGYNDLQHVHPELACEWDYELNDKKPYEIVSTSSYHAHWKCSEGHRWSAPVNARTSNEKIRICPQCHKAGTSFTEQCLIYYVKSYYHEKIEESVRLIEERAYEVDIWLPEKSLAIEYNGTYWHKDKHSEDETKYRLLSEQGVFTIYVLEPKGKIIADAPYYKMSKFNIKELEKSIRWVLERIGISIEMTDVDVKRDKMDIMRSYKTSNIARQFSHEYPELLEMWDYEKNNENMDYPYLFDCSSTEKVFWQCPHCGKKWRASVKQMIIGRSSCPECASCFTVLLNEKEEPSIDKECCLANTHPDIAKEWDEERNLPMSPETCPSSAVEELWWICSNGHKWQASPKARIKGEKCPYCNGANYNVLSHARPDIARYWHPTKNGRLTPDDVTTGSSIKTWWICDEEHEYETTVGARCLEGYKCPVCSGQKADARFNSISCLHPELVKLWHPTKNGKLTPDDVTCGSQKELWWTCGKGHEYMKYAKSMCEVQGESCPYCSDRKVLTGYNDLATMSPTLAKEWNEEKNEVSAFDVLYCSADRAHWKCNTCGHEWTSSIGARYRNQSGCPSCISAEKRINAIKESRGNNRPSYLEYFETHPELLLELPRRNDFEKIAKVMLSAMQTDTQSLTMLHIHYKKSFAEIAGLLDASELVVKTLYETLNLPDDNDETRHAHQDLLNVCRNSKAEEYGLTPEALIDWKILEKRTSKEIADEIGIGKSIIDRMSSKLGIGARRAKTTQQRFGKTRAWFWEEHVGKQRGYADIARELGVTNAIMEKLMKELDIPYLGACREEL